MTTEKLSIYGVGDVHPNREDPESIFALAAPTLKEADILFGQMEVILSERSAPQMYMFPVFRGHPKNVAALTYAGFDVMSFAGNHTLDCGEEACLDTLDLLRRNNIAVIGVGKDLDEARKPIILERKGTRVAFLDYCSVVPPGYEAWPAFETSPGKLGLAPMRASTFYEQVDWQPGTPPRILTFADEDDLEAMKEDIRKVRPQADIVVMSIHWGIHFVPAAIAMYQREVGHAAIDAGVDLILGHHAHILKGIEVYKGKVIFYSLCNFGFDFSQRRRMDLPRIRKSRELYKLVRDPEYPTYPFPVDSRKTIIAKCIISDKKIEKVSFLPVMVNKQSQPEVLPRSDKRSSEVLDYIDWCCKDQELNAKFSWEGDEVVIGT